MKSKKANKIIEIGKAPKVDVPNKPPNPEMIQSEIQKISKLLEMRKLEEKYLNEYIIAKLYDESLIDYFKTKSDWNVLFNEVNANDKLDNCKREQANIEQVLKKLRELLNPEPAAGPEKVVDNI